MKNKTIYDYSTIPERKWQWFFSDDHWIDAIIVESGVEYKGTDWSCQSGGGYHAGFQTFDEVLSKRPLQKMPKKIIKEVRDYILKHRVEGGATLRLVYVHELDGFQLSAVFVQLDETPIHIKRVRKKGKMTIYDGSIKQGKHVLGFVFVLRSESAQKKIDGEVKISIQEGTNTAVLKTSQDDKGKIVTEIVSE